MKAYSVKNVMAAKFKTLQLDGEWSEAFGNVQLTGTWMIYGGTKNGKTTLTMKLVKYLTKFGKVAYNSVEEGFILTTQMVMERVGMMEVAGKLVLLDKEPTQALIKRLNKRKSPNIIVIDTVQFAELTFSEYKKIKLMYPNKLFIYVSHTEGKMPEGKVARKILKDASVAIRVEGFKGFPVSRYGGGKTIIINEERADEYWGLSGKFIK